jgi:hypothetical protein
LLRRFSERQAEHERTPEQHGVVPGSIQFGVPVAEDVLLDRKALRLAKFDEEGLHLVPLLADLAMLTIRPRQELAEVLVEKALRDFHGHALNAVQVLRYPDHAVR